MYRLSEGVPVVVVPGAKSRVFIMFSIFKLKSNHKAAQHEQRPSLTQSVCVYVAALWLPPGLSKTYCPILCTHTHARMHTQTHTHPWGQGTRVQVEALTAQQLQVRQTCCTRAHTRAHQRTNLHTLVQAQHAWECKIELGAETNACVILRQRTHTRMHAHHISDAYRWCWPP